LKQIGTGSTASPTMKLEVWSGEKGDGELILGQAETSPATSR